MEQTIKMVVPCECPHCGQPIVLNITQPHPVVDVMTPEQLPEEIKNVIENHDTTQEPEAS